MIQMRRVTVIPAIMQMRFRSPQAAAAAAADWWLSGGISAANAIAAYAARGAASYAASKSNLANPGTYDLTQQGTDITWDGTNGWGANFLSSRFLKTGVTPATDQSWSVIALVSGGTAAYVVSVGASSTDGTSFFVGGHGGAASYWAGNGGRAIRSPGIAAGTIAVAGSDVYLDGSDDGGVALTTWTGSAVPIHIGGAYSSSTIASNVWDGYIQAIAIYDTTLTAPQVLAVSNAMAAL